MGGSGSTRWQNYERRLAVEDCFCASITDLFRYPLPTDKLGQIDWTIRKTGGILAFMFYQFDETDLTNQRIWTSVNRKIDGEMRSAEQWIGLEWTECNQFGGVRLWFRCPSPNGKCGNRRCGKLYLAPDGLTLACRECHDLTYESCQESHKYDRLNSLIDSCRKSAA